MKENENYAIRDSNFKLEREDFFKELSITQILVKNNLVKNKRLLLKTSFICCLRGHGKDTDVQSINKKILTQAVMLATCKNH